MLVQTENRTKKNIEDQFSLFINSLNFKINSIGTWTSSFSTQASYTSNDIEIVFYTQGGSYTQIQDKKYDCRVNDLMILKPFGLVTSINEGYDQYAYNYIHFEVFPATSTQDFLNLLTYADSVFTTNEAIQNIMVSIFEEHQKKEFGFQGIINALLKQLCIEIIRLQNQSGNHIPAVLENYTNNNFIVAEAMELINTHIYEIYPVAQLAFDLGISESHLYKTFKNIFKMSPSQYIATRKIIEAKKLLSYGLYTIGEIADMLNYSSANHFSSSFKKSEHMTPKQYQKIMLEPQKNTINHDHTS